MSHYIAEHGVIPFLFMIWASLLLTLIPLGLALAIHLFFKWYSDHEE